jgi:ABC-type dipeptide/oligopeptide/nickel transport system permease subunit
MSEPRSLPPSRNPFVTVLMVVAGIILLLPGLCSLVFLGTLVYEDPIGTFREPGLILLWAILIAIGWGGFLLIRRAVRNR